MRGNGMRLVCLLATALMTACGGGGGGGGSGSSPPSQDTPLDPSAPTFQFGGRYPERDSSLVMDAIAAGSRVLNMAQFTTDVVHRFASAGSPSTVTANCAYTGHVTLQFDDRDGDKRASVGDAVTVTLENCGVPAFARALTGKVRIDILSTATTAEFDFQARTTIVENLTIAVLQGWPNVGPVKTGTLMGSLNVQWLGSSTGSQLRASSATSDDMRFRTSDGGTELTDAMRKIDISRAARYDAATMGGSMSFVLDVSGNGAANVHTTLPFQGDLNMRPKQFTVDVEVADKQTRTAWGPNQQTKTIRAQLGQQVAGTDALVAMALKADGTLLPDTVSTPGWGESLSFVRDVRNSAEVRVYSNLGDGLSSWMPWVDVAFGSEIDRMCAQLTTGGVSNFQADALFQRPVVKQPGLTEPGAVVRLQMGRAISDSTPDYKFRFADAAEVPENGSPTWSVAATAVRRGAIYEIQLAEPLRRGRTYYLQASIDGVDWNAGVIFRDSKNEIVHQASSALVAFSTDNAVVAHTTFSDLALVGPGVPARLRADVSLRDGQTVASYRWEQVSGIPLRLVTPQAAETDALLDVTSQQLGDAVIQLTVTDSLGKMDRVRVALGVGTYVAQAAVLYVDSGNSLRVPRHEMSTGIGSFFYGPEAGKLSPRVVAANAGGTGTSFSVTPANGQRLAVGVYANAVHAEAAGPHNALMSRVFCNTDGAPVSGSFEVLDVAYAGDGTISRLAIDYVQRCEAGFNEYERASYRYNSAVPLTP